MRNPILIKERCHFSRHQVLVVWHRNDRNFLPGLTGRVRSRRSHLFGLRDMWIAHNRLSIHETSKGRAIQMLLMMNVRGNGSGSQCR